MLKFLSGGLVAMMMAGTSLAQSEEETLVDACVEGGATRAQCECAVDMVIEALDDNELAYMVALRRENTSDMARIMEIAAANGLDQTAMWEMGQKMMALDPELRAQCGIGFMN